MMQPQTPEKKKGFLDSLPKLGRVSQLVILIAVFLAVFAGLMLINHQLANKQIQQQKNLALLQRILASGQTPQAKFEADLAQTTAQAEAAEATFPTPDQTPEILDTLLQIAEDNDLYVTRTAVESETKKGEIGPTLSFTIGLSGQVSMFQNFLLALDTKLPTSRIASFAFAVAGSTGAYDAATIKIEVLCYKGE